MKVLAMDTAGPVIGVGLAIDGVARTRTERVSRGAEARLVPWALELCAEAGIRLDDLDGVAVAAGPGAFTGIRVGLAAAAGLAFGLRVPLWAGSSLEGRAARVEAAGPVLAMLDARKERVYAALYSRGELLAGPADVPPEEALAWADGAFTATGEGAVVYGELVGARGGRVAADADDPAVEVLARLGAEALGRGEGGDPAAVRPVYLRAPDARPPVRAPHKGG